MGLVGDHATGLAVLESRQCKRMFPHLIVLQEYEEVFSSELGTMKEFQAKLTICPQKGCREGVGSAGKKVE